MANLRKEKVRKDIGRFVCCVFFSFRFCGLIGFALFMVLVYKWVPVPGTPLMIIRKFETRDDGKSAPPIKHDWVSLENISPHLQLAVVCSEDQNYLKHYGIDWGAVEKAKKENEKRKRPRGASTISQQTAKNVFLWHGKIISARVWKFVSPI